MTMRITSSRPPRRFTVGKWLASPLVILACLFAFILPAAGQDVPPTSEHRSLQVSGNGLGVGNVSFGGDFAITGWVFLDEGTQLNSSVSVVRGNGWSLDFSGGVFTVNVAALGGTIADTNTPVQTGRWAHYGIVRTDGFVDVYINGNFETSSRTGDDLSQSLRPAWNNAAAVNDLFNGVDGVVDDFRLYNRSLPQADVQEILTDSFNSSAGLIRNYSFDGTGGAITDDSGTAGAVAVPAGSQFSGFLAPFVIPRVANEFSEVQVVNGLSLPTDLNFLPDGRMIVVEKSGLVSLFADPTVVNSQQGTYLDLRSVTDNVAERGMLAVAVDPDFDRNGFVYLYNTFRNPDNTIQKAVVRYVHREGAGGAASSLDPGSATIIWREAAVPLNSAANVHHGGGLAIAFEPINGADPSPHKLYIVTSDESIPNSSADLGSDNGKVHRVNLTDGSVPTDNPFFDAAAAARYNPQVDVTTSAAANGTLTTIHSSGVRNGWRASFDEPTGSLFIGEVGGSVQNGIEDIHVAFPRADYGWPTEEGPLNNPNDPGNPVLSYNHVGGPGRNDNPVNGTASVTGGVVYRGGEFPAEFEGAYFYGDWSRQWIRYATFDFTGDRPVLLEDNFFRNSTGRVLSFEQGPDGALYYLTTTQTEDIFTFAGQVNRVSFDTGNSAPFGSGILVNDADLTATSVPHQVQFVSNVTDAEGDALSYQWTFGDGSTSTARNPTHTFLSFGEFEVDLTVTDSNGAASAFPTVLIRIGNLPVVTVNGSQQGTYRAGDTITVDGFATNNGTRLPNSSLSWNSEYFISGSSRPGPFVNGTPYQTGGITFTTPRTGNVESFLTSVAVTLRGENAVGLSSTDTLTLEAETSSITIDAPNESVLIGIDGHNTTPGDFVFDGVVNFLFDFEAQSNYVENGRNFTFSHWSDNPALTNPVRQIAMPVNPVTIVPIYVDAGVATVTAANQACFFENADFSFTGTRGADFRTCAGVLGMTDFSNRFAHNDTISAISVGTGVHTIIYAGVNGTGAALCIDSSTDVNDLGALNNAASSFLIGTGPCP